MKKTILLLFLLFIISCTLGIKTITIPPGWNPETIAKIYRLDECWVVEIKPNGDLIIKCK